MLKRIRTQEWVQSHRKYSTNFSGCYSIFWIFSFDWHWNPNRSDTVESFDIIHSSDYVNQNFLSMAFLQCLFIITKTFPADTVDVDGVDKFEEIIRPKSENNCLSVSRFLHLMQSELNTKWRNISTRQPSHGIRTSLESNKKWRECFCQISFTIQLVSCVRIFSLRALFCFLSSSEFLDIKINFVAPLFEIQSEERNSDEAKS